MHATPLQRLIAAVPPALLLGLLIAALGGAALDAYHASLIDTADLMGSRSGWARATLVAYAVKLSSTVMIAVGLRELARRAPHGDAALVRAAAVVVALMVGQLVGSIYVRFVAPEAGWSRDWYQWSSRFALVAWITVGALLALAARVGGRALIVPLALGLLLATVLAQPVDTTYQLTHFGFDRHRAWHNAALDIFYGLAHLALVLVTAAAIGDRTPPPAGDSLRVAEGLARVGAALVARIVIAMGAAGLGVLAIVGKSPGLAKLAMVVVPAAGLIAMIALVSGMVQAGGPSDPRTPRWRFLGAAAFTLASLAITVSQAIATYLVVRHQLRADDDGLDGYRRESFEAIALAFPYAGPAIALAGLLCLVSAVASLRRSHDDRLGSADPSSAAALLVTFSISGLALQRWGIGHTSDAGTFALISIIVTIATIVAQLAVARLCHQVADALCLDVPTTLPAARVHDRG